MLLERMQPVPGLPELADSVYTGRRRGWRGRTKGELQKISPLRTEKYFLPFCSHMEAVLGFGTQSKMQWQRASRCKEGTVAWVLHSTQVHGAKFPRGYGYTEKGQDDPQGGKKVGTVTNEHKETRKQCFHLGVVMATPLS